LQKIIAANFLGLFRRRGASDTFLQRAYPVATGLLSLGRRLRGIAKRDNATRFGWREDGARKAYIPLLRDCFRSAVACAALQKCIAVNFP